MHLTIIYFQSYQKPEMDDIVMTCEKISIKCPITQKVMKHPIKNKHCGHCYDREGIEELIRHRGEKARLLSVIIIVFHMLIDLFHDKFIWQIN